MIDIKALANGRFVVVIALDQDFTGLVVFTFHLGRIEDDVISTT